MRSYVFILAVFSWWICSTGSLLGQDFILQGCYWDCPDDASADIDPASFNFWVKKMGKQSPELGHAGFSYIWLPGFYTGQEEQVGNLVETLAESGVKAFTDIPFYEGAGTEDSLRFPKQQIQWMSQFLKMSGFRLIANREIEPEALAQLLQQLRSEKGLPQLIAIRGRKQESAGKLAAYINRLESLLPDSLTAELDTRIFDYPLREALRQACSDPTFDVRQLFDSSIRDITALSGYKIVTFVNSPAYYNPNGISGDADDLIEHPLLAYAYLLTNNQLGLPAVFYGDYFGSESEIDHFIDKTPLREEIDQLIKTHKEFIFNSTSIEYLNHPDSPLTGRFLSAEDGAGAERALLFQLDGNNTPAGQAAGGGKDVLVAINFADTTLRVIHEINASNLRAGDRFTDILGRSNEASTAVYRDTAYGIEHAVYLELPPRSYSVWVHGKAEKVLPGSISFSAETLGQLVELSWEIPDESNVKGYQVERSINGGQFQPLSWLPALGSEGESAAYLFVDDNIFPNETLYYRIKAINFSNRFEYSTVEEVRIPVEEWQFEMVNEEASVQVFNIRSNFSDDVIMSIFNAEGELVLSKKKALQVGSNQARVDLSGFPKGVYFIKFTTSREKEWTQRIVLL